VRKLRGERYLIPEDENLKWFILERLPYLDFQQTCDFYDAIRNCDEPLGPRGIALLGCNDRFFLFTILLNRLDAMHPWLFDRCREVEGDPDGYLDLWSRFHYKSSIITFAGNIQDVLCDPEITICILSHTKDIAKPFLSQIKNELENNEYLKAIYSDVLYEKPQNESPKWSEADGIIVKRKSNPKEATIEAHGLDAQPTSRHYDKLVYDDIVTEKNAKNPEMIKKATLGWENSDNLGKPGGVRKQHAGTRWSFGDSYGILLERKSLKPRVYPATDDGTLKGRPVFLTPKRWAEIKSAQKSTVSAQMLLNPVAGTDAMFHSTWFRTYDVMPQVMNVYIVCDPSKGKSKNSDRTAIAVIGVDAGGNKYLLDGVRHRMRLSSRYDFLKRFWLTWSNHPGVQCCKVGYEVYGQQADHEVIEEYQERDRIYFEISELNYPRQGPHSKEARVERLEPDMKSGRFYLPSVVHHAEVGGIDGKCLWTVWRDEDQARWDIKNAGAGKICPYNVGQVIYRAMQGRTKMERWCEVSGQFHRIVRPIKRIAEDKEVYDLTRAFIEEARFFPFAPHDDLIDATARIYDMDVQLPTQYEASATMALGEDDLGKPWEIGDDLEDQHYDA
jgi:hypothetical protein